MPSIYSDDNSRRIPWFARIPDLASTDLRESRDLFARAVGNVERDHRISRSSFYGLRAQWNSLSPTERRENQVLQQQIEDTVLNCLSNGDLI